MINSIDKTKLIVIAPSDAEPVSLETCHLKITLARIADVNLEKERPIFLKRKINDPARLKQILTQIMVSKLVEDGS